MPPAALVGALMVITEWMNERSFTLRSDEGGCQHAGCRRSLAAGGQAPYDPSAATTGRCTSGFVALRFVWAFHDVVAVTNPY